jgi:7,8-dihydropterin-6-yl-methyl-4-(beta-D-ribofuranosyl)aminobenzene 5'-phosphate synthase
VPAWGFAVHIRRGQEEVLFDCGWRADMLIATMKALGISASRLAKIIISHDHWDHSGGLPVLLSHAEGAQVFIGKSFSPTLIREIAVLADVNQVSGEEYLSPWLYTTGEMGEEIREQSIALSTQEGVLVITGCAHPGLDRIIEKVGEIGTVTGLLGGFHDFENIDFLSFLSIVVPCHCTMKKKEILASLPEIAQEGGVGYRLIIQ